MASSAQLSVPMNPWEARALDYDFPQEPISSGPGNSLAATRRRMQRQDPVIYPGLYSSSGFDIMSILFQVMSRPDPQIELGPIDCSVAILLCDLEAPDCPIAYVTDSFCTLTKYSQNEVLGRNCRFLQTPRGKHAGSHIKAADKMAIHRMRQAVNDRNEVQLQVTNYKKNGQQFINLLSIIPIVLADTGRQYAIGFQVESD